MKVGYLCIEEEECIQYNLTACRNLILMGVLASTICLYRFKRDNSNSN